MLIDGRLAIEANGYVAVRSAGLNDTIQKTFHAFEVELALGSPGSMSGIGLRAESALVIADVGGLDAEHVRRIFQDRLGELVSEGHLCELREFVHERKEKEPPGTQPRGVGRTN